jgi:acetate kinase
MATVLTVNTGSSSVRLAAFALPGLAKIADAHHRAHGDEPRALLRAFLETSALRDVSVAAHRVVHGGARLTAPCLLDAAVEGEIARLAPLAPLHNPRALEWIGAARAALGAVPQVAAFDTAFFAALPEAAATYALPRDLSQRLGLRRFGFHGLAHEAMVRRWHELRPDGAGRVISLQLGAGCSIAATRDGQAVDTSMGFSPLEGLVMATRAGDLDPGLLLHLQRAEGMTPEGLEQLLNEESGLRGVSGTSGDMRRLLASGEPAARLAIEVYCYRARKYVGAYLAALGGADAVLFGGGVGEHAPEVRERILAGMAWAGIALDAARNRAARGGEARIDAAHGGPEIHVVAVDEAALLAQKAMAVLARPR